MRNSLFLAVWLVPHLLGAQITMSATDTSGFPGEVVASSIRIGHPEPARAFSFGLVHDDNIVSLQSISQGAVVSATNGGAGADYFFVETNPPGGPGGVVACVISLEAPLEEIPAGAANEVAICNYDILATAPAGASTALTFTDQLGDPPVLVVVSIDGVSNIPAVTNGSITVLTSAVQGLECMITDACDCDVMLSWTNPGVFQQIQIFEDGNSVATLAGDQTAFSFQLAATGETTLGVQAIGLMGSVSTTVGCTLDCREVSVAAPENLTCLLDFATCEVSLTWTNPETYNFIEVTVNGVVDQQLPGNAESAVVSLAPDVLVDVGLQGTGTCFEPFEDIFCAPLQCSPSFCAPVTNLQCARNGEDIDVTWINGDSYNLLNVFRNDGLIATLLGTATGFTDPNVPPGVFEYAIEGDCGGASFSPRVTCGLAVPCDAITNFVCTLDGNDVELTWTNNEVYDVIRILRDGGVIATLLGTTQTFTDTDAPMGTHLYVIEPDCGSGQMAPSDQCEVDVPPLFCEPVMSLTCETIEEDVALTWMNGETYNLIRVFRNALLIATLPGTAMTFTDSDLPAATYVYNVQGECSGGDLTTAEECIAVHDPLPFLRGDCDGDMTSNGLLDALFALNFQFVPNSPVPPCLEACDADNNQTFNGLLDGLFILDCQFIPMSPCPASPFPTCGPDPDAASSLGCGPNACL